MKCTPILTSLFLCFVCWSTKRLLYILLNSETEGTNKPCWASVFPMYLIWMCIYLIKIFWLDLTWRWFYNQFDVQCHHIWLMNVKVFCCLNCDNLIDTITTDGLSSCVTKTSTAVVLTMQGKRALLQRGIISTSREIRHTITGQLWSRNVKKKTRVYLNPGGLKMTKFYENNIFHCMVEIFVRSFKGTLWKFIYISDIYIENTNIALKIWEL